MPSDGLKLAVFSLKISPLTPEEEIQFLGRSLVGFYE